MFFDSPEEMIAQMREQIAEIKLNPEISANYIAIRDAAKGIADRCNYSRGLAAQCAMAMKINVTKGNEAIAAEMMICGVELAKQIADDVGGGPDAVLEACRQMEFTM